MGRCRLRHESFFLPRQPSDEAAGVSAYGEFSCLVQTASKRRKKGALLEDTKQDDVRKR